MKSCRTNDKILALPLDALSMTMEYLSPRDLFNTAFTCKTLRDAVTTRMVLHSALAYGKYPKRSMIEIEKLMKNYSIHVPSPMRLLRLACGTLCEVCFQNKVNFVRPNYGLFVCFDCLKAGLTKIWRYTSEREKICTRDEYDTLFRHSRVTFFPYEDSRYMLVKPKCDAIGDSIGPIVTLEDIDEMVVHSDGLDGYITNVLKAPDRKAYDDFNHAFDAIDEVNLRKESAKLERKLLKLERNEVNRTKKHKSIDAMLGCLAKTIEEPFRELTLKRKLLNAPSKRRYAQMHVTFLDEVLEPYIIAPSKATKKIIKQLADEINSKFQIILDKGFLSLSFLSEDDPFESRLKHFFDGKIGPSLSDLVSFKIDNHSDDEACRVDSEFISLIANNKFIDALNHLAKGLHFVLLHDFREHEDLSRSYYLARDINFQNKFSRYVWQNELKAQEGKEDADLYKSAFTSVHSKFRDLWSAILNYEDWLEEDNQPGYRRTHMLETSYLFETNGNYMLLTEPFLSLCDAQWDLWRHERRYERRWNSRWYR